MNTGLKITAYAAALAATFGTAYGVGSGTAPLSAGTERAGHAEHETGDVPGSGGRQQAGHVPAAAGGLQVSEGGYTLDLRTPRVEAGRRGEIRFGILDRAGRPVTAYRKEHGKELHLILASRDLVTYRHLHPARAADGTWSTAVKLPEAGDYRVFADFAPAAGTARGVTLGADLAAAGAYEPDGLPEPSREVRTDGYTVALDGEPRAGSAEELSFEVSRDGKAVTDLQPYLGAYGHLVALRAGDLAYLHVHPNGEPGDDSTEPGPGVSFTATAPSPGTYRLFLDFKHDGKVRTAAFTVTAGGAGDAGSDGDTGGAEAPAREGGEADGHQH